MKRVLGDDPEAGQLLLGGPGSALASNSALTGAAGVGLQLGAMLAGRPSIVAAIAAARSGGGGSGGGDTRDHRVSIPQR